DWLGRALRRPALLARRDDGADRRQRSFRIEPGGADPGLPDDGDRSAETAAGDQSAGQYRYAEIRAADDREQAARDRSADPQRIGEGATADHHSRRAAPLT